MVTRARGRQSWLPAIAMLGLLIGACTSSGAPGGAAAPPGAGAAPASSQGATAAGSGTAPTGGTAPAGPPHKITLPYSPIAASSAPLYIAADEGLFARQGLEVELQFVGGSSAIIQGMAANQYELGGIGGGDVAHNRVAGGDLTMIATYVPTFTMEGISKPEIRSPADLKGKVIAVTRLGTSSHLAGMAMLGSVGLKPDDATFIQTGGVSESLAALLSGNVDAGMIGYPQNLEAKKAGYRTITTFPDLGDYGLFPQNAIGAREAWLRDPANRAVAVRFLRALGEGLALAKAGGEPMRASIRKYVKVDDEAIVENTVEFYREFFPATLRVPEASIANMLRFLDEPEARALAPKLLYDNSLVDEIERVPSR
jgi:NitT/TauT family transport system substrate-binding protein